MEAKKKKKVFIGTPTIGTYVDSQSYFMREIERIYADHVEFYYPATCVRRKFHDFARNMQVEEFLASDCDVLWFLDSDITPSAHVMDMVAVHWDKWKVAGAPYPVFMNPTGASNPEVVYTVYDIQPKSGNMAPANIPKEGFGYVAGIATGCLFIKREVFSLLEKPYFEFKYDPKKRSLTEGEDLGFCQKMHKLGIPFFIDYSAICKHEKTVDLVDVNNYAIAFCNRSLKSYETAVKDMTRKAVSEAYQAGYQKGLSVSGNLAPPAKPRPKGPNEALQRLKSLST